MKNRKILKMAAVPLIAIAFTFCGGSGNLQVADTSATSPSANIKTVSNGVAVPVTAGNLTFSLTLNQVTASTAQLSIGSVAVTLALSVPTEILHQPGLEITLMSTDTVQNSAVMSFAYKLPADLEIPGEYVDNFNGDYSITKTTWENYGCVKTVVSFDNTAKYLIYQEAMNAACYNQGKFGKIYWTQVQASGSFYHCENAYGKNTAAAALADATPPSASNLASGCGGFSWSSMTRKYLQIVGEYTDNYAGPHAITQNTWENYGCVKTIVSYDNAARAFVYQESNDVVNCYNPNKYGKVYWTQVQANGSFNYCENVYAKTTAAAALADASPPSGSNLATGCGGFSWSSMTRKNIQIIGSYTDNYAGTHAITQTTWTNYGCLKTIVAYDNVSRYFVYQESNDAVNCYNPNKYGKVYWTQVQGNGNFYYCENVYAKGNSTEATNDASPPAGSNLASGCGGFSWSYMTKN